MEILTIERTLTELDHVRLTNLLLRDVLHACTIVPARAVSPDVVTMYSQVLLLDRTSGEHNELTLCYPADSDPSAGFISVLSPLGWSLLGLREGDVVYWSTPTGCERAAKVVAILFQPEACGDYAT
jgi:regulator of nucleoside diphosphate kinase